MNTLQDRIRATRAHLRIAVKQYNQAQRLLERLKKHLDQLEQKDALARTKQKAKSAK